MSDNATRVSVVIPVLGDDAALERLLLELKVLHPAPFEIIVVDGAGSSSCAAICKATHARLIVSPAGRGSQLNAGAQAARGDVLWFLHADAEAAKDALAAIVAAVRAGASGGYFRFRFSGASKWNKRLLAALINWRARWGIPYGDQGLFATREAFRAAGGFADAPLFEEVALVRALRRQGHLVALDCEIGVSCRRWERDGWLRRSLLNRALALGHALGLSPALLARHYRRPASGRGKGAAC